MVAGRGRWNSDWTVLRKLARHPVRWGALTALLVVTPLVWLHGPLRLAIGAVVVSGTIALWTLVRRRWVAERRVDWARFDEQFSAYVERVERRRLR